VRNLNKIVLKAHELARNNTKVLIFANSFVGIKPYQQAYTPKNRVRL